MAGREKFSAESFPDGSILRIVFNNFLTYDTVEVLPCPNLNIIIGCNGTGKSSILCGICLAFGGSPKILGRSERIEDYVKIGCKRGSVEVFVRDSKAKDGCITVKVEVTSTSNTAKYFVNGKMLSHNAVRDTAEKYNIQVANPCTFLAQDKVRSFAEQTPKLLLQNTMEAGSGDILVAFNEARKLRRIGSDLDDEQKKLGSKLKTVVGKLATLAPRVENFLHYEGMKEKIALLQKKLAIIECESVMKDVEAVNARQRDKEKEVEKIRHSLVPLDKLLADEQKKLDSHSENLKKIHAKMSADARNLRSMLAYPTIPEQLKVEVDLYERREKDYAEWEADIKTKRNILANFQSTCQASAEEARVAQDSVEKLKQSFAEAVNEKSALARRKLNLNHESSRIVDQLNGMLREESALEEEKVAQYASHTRQSNSADAYRYYLSHKEDFRFPVFVPFLSIEMRRADSAKYLENVVVPRDLHVFIFGCEEDEMRLFRAGQWRLDCSVLTREEVDKYSRVDPLSNQLRSHGFTCYVADLVTGPKPVMAYLNNVSHINQIPIGGAEVNPRIEEICETLKGSPVRQFLTDVKKVSMTTSRYSHNTTIVIKPLQTRLRFFTSQADLRDREEDRKKRTAKRAELENRNRELAKEQEEVEDNLKKSMRAVKDAEVALNGASEKIERFQMLQMQVVNSEKILRTAENNKPDLAKANDSLKASRAAVVDDAFSRAKDAINLLRGMKDDIRVATLEGRQCLLAREAMRPLNERKTHFNADLELKQGELEDVKKDMAKFRRDLLAVLEELKAKTKLSSVVENELANADEVRIFRQLKKDFETHKVPNTEEEVQRELGLELGRQLALDADGQQQDVEAHRTQLQKQESLEKDITTVETRIAKWKDEMEAALNGWMTPLEALIANISRHFSLSFLKLRCEGEVRLERPEDKFDIENYGIALMVRFREGEPLQRLTHLVQSGGERSVATMLYVMALQQLCPVPFRCVDEINQGMDPTNERRVMDMMMDMLSGSGKLSKTQYFLSTPKLLKGLKYAANVQVHCVVSSHFVRGLKDSQSAAKENEKVDGTLRTQPSRVSRGY